MSWIDAFAKVAEVAGSAYGQVKAVNTASALQKMNLQAQIDQARANSAPVATSPISASSVAGVSSASSFIEQNKGLLIGVAALFAVAMVASR